MTRADSDIIAEFTKEITRLNLCFKQYLQSKLRQNNIDLTFEMLQVLGYLWRTDGVNQQEIANMTVKDKASMTYLVDNLVKRELVYRQEDSNDRRSKLIYLTKEGRALQKIIEPLVQEMYALAGENIKLDGVSKIIKDLGKIRENLRTAEV